MNRIHRIFWLFFIALIAFSCDEGDNEVTPRGQFTNGVLIVNEGNFGSGNGSLSFYYDQGDSLLNGVYEEANSGTIIGASIQSVFSTDELVLIITNSPDKVEVVQREDFEVETTSIAGDDIVQPRYATVVNNTAYVSCWGPWGENFTLPDSYVAVIDLSTFEVTNTIDVGDGAEGIISLGNELFVADSYSNTISVIDVASETVTDQIEVDNGPVQMVLDADNMLWAACSGAFITQGSVVKVNPQSKTEMARWQPEGFSISGKLAIDGDQNDLYWITAAAFPETTTEIFTASIADTEAPDTPMIEGNNFYGIGVDPDSGDIYVGDSQGFVGDGYVQRYQSDGSKLDEFQVGIGPNGFVFY